MATKEKQSTGNKTCFVIMGFGEKTDYQTGRVLNLDKSYKNIIKPAVEATGLTCTRADDIRHSGVIDVPMYEQLLMADVVIADLSTYNSNATYELGVRHALRPYTTIAIAEKEWKYPFDLNHIVIRSYEHLGKDIGVDEANRMRVELKKAIRAILAKPAPDSPIYTYMKNLTPPQIRKAAKPMAGKARTQSSLKNSEASDNPRLSSLWETAMQAGKKGDWMEARDLLGRIRHITKDETGRRSEDHFLIQQLAFATYKSEQPDLRTALLEARDLLLTLDPDKTHDPETAGLLGAVSKRLYDLNPSDRALLETALASYEHGFYLKNDYYNGINLAYLLNLRASISSGDDVVADRVVAQRVRRKVIAICQGIDSSRLSPEDQYWIAATLEEAHFGLGEAKAYEQAKAVAEGLAPKQWMRLTTVRQLEKLQKLLGRDRLGRAAVSQR